MVEIVTEIVGTIVIDGVSHLLERFVDEVGNIIWRAFTDADGDGLPDDYDNPFQIWDEEPDGWLPFPSGGDDEPEQTQTVENIVILTPDGITLLFPNTNSENYNAVVTAANDQWLQLYGATTKDFKYFSVSEALLFIIAACSLFWLFGRIFKRRKL